MIEAFLTARSESIHAAENQRTEMTLLLGVVVAALSDTALVSALVWSYSRHGTQHERSLADMREAAICQRREKQDERLAETQRPVMHDEPLI